VGISPRNEYQRLDVGSIPQATTTTTVNTDDSDESAQRKSPKNKRRHRLLEAFLHITLKMGWENVHDYAEKMYPFIDDQLEELIYQAAGCPTTCPHGDPIPDKNGTVVIPNDILLSKVTLKKNVIISRVKTKNISFLQFLSNVKIIPGENVTLLNTEEETGEILLGTKSGNNYLISKDLANSLFVLICENTNLELN